MEEEEEEDEIDYSNLEFEEDDGFLMEQLPPPDDLLGEEPKEIAPPEYVIANSIARHKHLCHILAVYYHAKHGESMADIFEHLQDTPFIMDFHVSE